MQLYELNANPANEWRQRCHLYEQTLTALEEEKLTAAQEQVATLRMSYPDDSAVIALEKRIDEALQQGDIQTTAIWQLPGK